MVSGNKMDIRNVSNDIESGNNTSNVDEQRINEISNDMI